LRGGLEAQGICKIRVYGRDGRRSGCFVAKPLRGSGLREYKIHAAIAAADCGALAARVLGWQPTGPNAGYLFLEWIPAISWPWRDPNHASLVMRQLARLHCYENQLLTPALDRWDYESELDDSAWITVDLYRRLFVTGFRAGSRPMIKPLERFCEALPEIRKRLRAFGGTSVLHGDVHPGNTVIHAAGLLPRAVFIDWGRARAGAPLEDVCSWLHSLGFWEPEARRVHDRLLKTYLHARGLDARLTPSLREACWLAGGCNAMAGALRYHLEVANDPLRPEEQRSTSVLAAADWLRIIRRADDVWRS
jgi:hypothetical protein